MVNVEWSPSAVGYFIRDGRGNKLVEKVFDNARDAWAYYNKNLNVKALLKQYYELKDSLK